MQFIKLLWNLIRFMNLPKKTDAEVRKIQEKKLRKILHFAYDRSPYYRKSFKNAGITKDSISSTPLSAFPTINKELLVQHFDDLVTETDVTQDHLQQFDESESGLNSTFLNKYHVVHSSGSTGIPRYFIYDKAAWSRMVLGIIRGALWDMSIPEIFKMVSGGLRVLYIAATDGRYGGAMAAGGGTKSLRAKQLYLDINTPLSEWANQVKSFQPNIIVGYPSAIKILGELVEEERFSLNLFRMVSCGEPLSPGLRSYLENVFDTKVANVYGTSESLAMGVEISAESGMYLFDDLNVIEVIDGKMYLTCLYNFTQPLIRYHISDKLELLPKNPSDKYAFTKTEIVLSRNEDILWFQNKEGKKEFLHPLSVEGFCIDGLLDYQFRQTANDAFEMLAETQDASYKQNIEIEMQIQMQIILSAKGLNYVDFSVHFVDRIMPDKNTGKKRLILV